MQNERHADGEPRDGANAETPHTCDRCGDGNARGIEGSEYDYLCRGCFMNEVSNSVR